MFCAAIDQYYDEISRAIKSGDDRQIAEIAKCFYHRHDKWMAWEVVEAVIENSQLDGVKAHLHIKFRDETTAVLTIGYHCGKRLVTLNGEAVNIGSMDGVVDRLAVPISFIDGMFVYACSVAQNEVKVNANLSLQSRKLFDFCERLKAELGRLKEEKKQAQKQINILQRSSKSVFLRLPEIAPEMPHVPTESLIDITTARRSLSGVSGIYFAWCLLTGKCVYVGKSKNMGSRLSCGRAELDSCRITWIEMPDDEIHFAELYYIWLLKPCRNGQANESRKAIATGDAKDGR